MVAITSGEMRPNASKCNEVHRNALGCSRRSKRTQQRRGAVEGVAGKWITAGGKREQGPPTCGGPCVEAFFAEAHARDRNRSRSLARLRSESSIQFADASL